MTGDAGARRPSPQALWSEAGGNRERYLELMREHGHIVEGQRPPGEDIFGHTPLLAVPETINGTADLHQIESIEISRRPGVSPPSLTIRCACRKLYELDEYPGHLGVVIWASLREAGVPSRFRRSADPSGESR